MSRTSSRSTSSPPPPRTYASSSSSSCSLTIAGASSTSTSPSTPPPPGPPSRSSTPSRTIRALLSSPRSRHRLRQPFRHRVKGMRIREVLTAPQRPWQNPFAERLIGSVRRECLDHVLVLSDRHLRRLLTRYFAYYHRARTHLALDKDAPDMRPIQRRGGPGRGASRSRWAAPSLRPAGSIASLTRRPTATHAQRHTLSSVRTPRLALNPPFAALGSTRVPIQGQDYGKVKKHHQGSRRWFWRSTRSSSTRRPPCCTLKGDQGSWEYSANADDPRNPSRQGPRPAPGRRDRLRRARPRGSGRRRGRAVHPPLAPGGGVVDTIEDKVIAVLHDIIEDCGGWAASRSTCPPI